MSAVDTTKWEWGPAAVATLIVLAALTVVAGASLALFWVSATYDTRALVRTLVLAAIVVDLAAMGWISRRLCGRQP